MTTTTVIRLRETFLATETATVHDIKVLCCRLFSKTVPSIEGDKKASEGVHLLLKKTSVSQVDLSSDLEMTFPPYNYFFSPK